MVCWWNHCWLVYKARCSYQIFLGRKNWTLQTPLGHVPCSNGKIWHPSTSRWNRYDNFFFFSRMTYCQVLMIVIPVHPAITLTQCTTKTRFRTVTTTTTIAILDVHMLCGASEGRLYHFLPQLLRGGLVEYDQPGKNPLKHSATVGNRTQATQKTSSEIHLFSHWAIMTATIEDDFRKQHWKLPAGALIQVWFACNKLCQTIFDELTN